MAKKQQETIREMSMKKLLNGEQKKVLYKLFEAKIITKIKEAQQKHNHDEEVLSNELEEKAIGKGGAIQKLMDDIKNADELIGRADKKIDEAGFTRSRYGKEFSITGKHKEIAKMGDNWRIKRNKMEELKLQLLADIHGLPMTYKEMTSYIEKEIARIME